MIINNGLLRCLYVLFLILADGDGKLQSCLLEDLVTVEELDARQP
jgi:hypothetical protein